MYLAWEPIVHWREGPYYVSRLDTAPDDFCKRIGAILGKIDIKRLPIQEGAVSVLYPSMFHVKLPVPVTTDLIGRCIAI